MPITSIYGPQAWTAGTISVATNTTSDGDYPEITYLERVDTRDGLGPSGERIVDTYQANPDYSIGAVELRYFGPETGGHWDTRGGDGNGTYYELDVKFSSDAEADSGDYSYPISIGDGPLNMVAVRVALTEGKIYIEEQGSEDEPGFGAITADDAWYTLKLFVTPSSDDGFTDDGVIRLWIKDSTDPASAYTLLFEKTNSSVYSPGDPFLLDRVWLGRYGLLPTTNLHIYYGEADATVTGTSIFGEDGTVAGVSRVHLLNLDGVTRTLSDTAFEGSAVIGGRLVFFELASPPAGVTNTARIWAEDSGGKTRLMFQGPTGSAQQIAIEP
jgi:hypothetical protein